MTQRVFNFGAGPATLPLPVLEQVRDELLDYHGLGASVIEISHRSKEFDALMNETDELIQELAQLPSTHKILYVHGGAQMQFSAIPLNLLGLKPARKAVYYETGNFARLSKEEAMRYGQIQIGASSAATRYDRIPEFDPAQIPAEASYAYITSNNTIFGTRWQTLPATGEVPLVVDATSEVFSRVMDFSKIGLLFAGLQKNLGVSGMALVIVREDLLGFADPLTPKLLNYQVYAKDHSLTNTINTFAIYVMNLMLKWMKKEGGIAALEEINERKAARLYQVLDRSPFYKALVHPAHRSTMNVTFDLPTPDLLEKFVKEANKAGLYALKGHREAGGARASIYNPMPLAGVEALAAFMEEFERTHG